MTNTKNSTALPEPFIVDVNGRPYEVLPFPSGCWSCGRLECPEPDGVDCHAYVASVEIPDEEIPF